MELSKRTAALLCGIAAAAFCGFTNPFTREDTPPAAESTQQVFFQLTGVKDSPTQLSARELERRLGLEDGELKAVTLTGLPAEEQGKLCLDGKPVKKFQELSRRQLDKLTYYAKEQEIPASFSFIPKCKKPLHAAVSIAIQEEKEELPVLKGDSFSTMEGISAVRNIELSHAKGRRMTYSIASAPEKGTVSFSENSYVYTPYQGMNGSDSFTFYGVDEQGNTTQDAVVSIRIDAGAKVYFEDMAASPSEYAAVKLCEAGILSGEQIGGHRMFYPQKQVNRLEFVMMLLAAIGQPPIPCVNTGLKGDENFPIWAKPYIQAGIHRGIITEDDFEWDAIPIRAEAVVLTDRAAAITDVKRYYPAISDFEEIPSWALSSYVNLGAYKMLDFYDGAAHPHQPLTRERAADLIWQLYKLKENRALYQSTQGD